MPLDPAAAAEMAGFALAVLGVTLLVVGAVTRHRALVVAGTAMAVAGGLAVLAVNVYGAADAPPVPATAVPPAPTTPYGRYFAAVTPPAIAPTAIRPGGS